MTISLFYNIIMLRCRMDITGKNMIALFIQGCVFFCLIILIEFNFFYHPKPSAKPKIDGEVEEDVLTEQTAVHEGTLQAVSLALQLIGPTMIVPHCDVRDYTQIVKFPEFPSTLPDEV